MNIKEVEEKTGLARSNIRFYEKEGLLKPRRSENGYRSYSEEDVAQLQKLRLLRGLGVSLEVLRELEQGNLSLCSVLESRAEAISQEQLHQENAQTVCRRMCQEQVHYATLEPSRFLDALDSLQPPETDKLPYIPVPWRRFFARMLDLLLYSLVLSGVLTLTTSLNFYHMSVWMQILQTVVILAMFLFLEPALLHLFGATFGKWILGLSVVSVSGRKLTYEEGLERTWGVLSKGVGFYIPVWTLVRHGISFHDCRREASLPWEDGSVELLHDRKAWRIPAAVAAALLIAALDMGFFQIQSVPSNRGALTVAQFSENYNQMSEFHRLGQGNSLDSNGSWHSSGSENLTPESLLIPSAFPEYQYETVNGRLTGFRMEVNYEGEAGWLCSCEYNRILSAMAFVRARGTLLGFGDETDLLIRQLQEHGLESWEMDVNGVHVSNQAAVSGYASGMNQLMPLPEGPWFYHLVFSMEVTE